MKVDLTGRRFGKLYVYSFDRRSNGKYYWNCLCDCGVTKSIYSHSLLSGDTKTCGKCSRKKDITGQKFGKLTVFEFSHVERKKRYYWKCKCDCGNILLVDAVDLKSGNTQSCGCLMVEAALNRWKKNKMNLSSLGK